MVIQYKKFNEKRDKGYVEGKPPEANTKEQPKEPPREHTSSGKKNIPLKWATIYGPKAVPNHPAGGVDVHTRVKGRTYVPMGDTRFHYGMKARVKITDDGHLNVSDLDGEWTQTWDAVEEAVDRAVLEFIIESFSKQA